MATPAAKLLKARSHLVPSRFHITELFFEVPLNYADPSAGKLTLFARNATPSERPLVPPSDSELQNQRTRPFMVYLEGGPGFGNREPQELPLTPAMLTRGYQMLFLDYRGTGLSTPINAADLVAKAGDDPAAQAAYLRHFRQDNIVRDCEAVRKCLTAKFPVAKQKWSLLGQSFGGFVALSYLSRYPDALREVFLTGGLAPVGKAPDRVYRQTYQKVIERNAAYYNKFPEDRQAVQHLAQYILEKGPLRLPAGGLLTVPRLLSMGLHFGSHQGLDYVHSVILRMSADLLQFSFFTRATLSLVEQINSFDNNPIYAILHEPIYCCRPGIASRWSAERVGRELPEFAWLDEAKLKPDSTIFDQPLYFSGEMIYRSHFDTHPELKSMSAAADILAEADDWEELYDEDQLRQNNVPVYAASYIEDMYVDAQLARETVRLVRNCRVFETNVIYHNGLRAHSDEVLTQLFKLRDDVID